MKKQAFCTKRQTTIWLTEDGHFKLRVLSASRRQSASEIIESLLEWSNTGELDRLIDNSPPSTTGA